MNEKNENCQTDLFGTQQPVKCLPLVTLELRGLGAIPSFKNRKLIRTWLDKSRKVEEFRNGHWWIRKDSMKIRALLYLEPELQAWMDEAIARFELQLRSALQTAGVTIQTGALAHSRIATLLPCDDAWVYFRELRVKSELCAPGQEGATIVIEPL